MPMVWLKARAAFTFQGRPLAIDDVFGATPIEAVQLRARRLVEFARGPKPSDQKLPSAADVLGILEPYRSQPAADQPPPRRPRGRPRKVAQEQTEPEPVNVATNWESSVNWPGPTDDAA
jgi:hypothetical protein